MMISPMAYVGELRGQSKEKILSAIRGLKRRIKRLKRIIEHPDYKVTMCPSERVQLAMCRDYLDFAIAAYVEAGGEYKMTAEERRAAEFQAGIEHIETIEFEIGKFFGGYDERRFIIDGDHERCEQISLPYNAKISDFTRYEGVTCAKKDLFECILSLNIGEWDRSYSPSRYGIEVLDGWSWELKFTYRDGRRPVTFGGCNLKPYNFDKLTFLLHNFDKLGEYDVYN